MQCVMACPRYRTLRGRKAHDHTSHPRSRASQASELEHFCSGEYFVTRYMPAGRQIERAAPDPTHGEGERGRLQWGGLEHSRVWRGPS